MMEKLDHAILRLTMKAAYAIDYRWHTNNYIIAKWFSILAAVCAVLCPILYFMPPIENRGTLWFAIGFLLPINTFCALSYLRRADKLQIASDKFERNPSVAPYEAIVFLLTPPIIRIIPLIFTSMVMLPLIAVYIADHKQGIIVAILGWICRLWLFFGDCIALYFAGIPPSHRKRKEKKQEAPMGAVFAGVKI